MRTKRARAAGPHTVSLICVANRLLARLTQSPREGDREIGGTSLLIHPLCQAIDPPGTLVRSCVNGRREVTHVALQRAHRRFSARDRAGTRSWRRSGAINLSEIGFCEIYACALQTAHMRLRLGSEASLMQLSDRSSQLPPEDSVPGVCLLSSPLEPHALTVHSEPLRPGRRSPLKYFARGRE